MQGGKASRQKNFLQSDECVRMYESHTPEDWLMIQKGWDYVLISQFFGANETIPQNLMLRAAIHAVYLQARINPYERRSPIREESLFNTLLKCQTAIDRRTLKDPRAQVYRG